MKKIPTLFERIYINHHVVETTPNVTPGLEWVLDGEGTATVKIDGSCCAIINGEFYKRYDANPYGLKKDTLVRHGTQIIQVERTFDGIRDFLRNHCMEGIVFWKDGVPQCKIKRSDFGFPWPEEGAKL